MDLYVFPALDGLTICSDEGLVGWTCGKWGAQLDLLERRLGDEGVARVEVTGLGLAVADLLAGRIGEDRVKRVRLVPA